MARDENPYLLRRLEESSGYYGKSFSNRYTIWKKNYSVRNAFKRESERRASGGPLKILEVGCGDGWLIFRLKAEFGKRHGLQFFGIDVSGFDIDFADHRKEYFGHKDCRFQVMEAERLSFNDGEFDIVISSETVEHLPDPIKAVKEAHRVLKKGGLFIVTTPHKGSGLLARFLRLLKRRAGAGAGDKEGWIPEEEASRMRLSSDGGSTGEGRGHISVKSGREWVDIFRTAGFTLRAMKGTGGLLFGSPRVDSYRMLFAATVILDVILERLPLSYLWSETLFFELRK